MFTRAAALSNGKRARCVTENPRSASPDLYEKHVLFCSSMNHPGFFIPLFLMLRLMNHSSFKFVSTQVRLLAVFDMVLICVVNLDKLIDVS